MANATHHALVIGASGFIGWSVANQLLAPYPLPSPYLKVTKLVNRPLKLSDSFWPKAALGRPSLALFTGVDLLCSDGELVAMFKRKVENVESITHVYYCAFKEHAHPEKEVEINVGMMRRVVRAVKVLSPNLQFFVYPGGTRGYGIYRPDGIFSASLTEDMADTLPEDYAKTASYPHYRAMLTEESVNSSWSWCEVCPDIIVGFTPNDSTYSLAGHWAAYLSAYKVIYGEGAEVPFPGTTLGYDSKFTEASATTLARVAIHASLHSTEFKEKIFNVADCATPSSMRERWPQIVEYFGLKGAALTSTASAEDLRPSDFIQEHRDEIEKAGRRKIEIFNATQLDSVGYWLTFDRHLSLDRLKKAGFGEMTKPEDGWLEAFEMFRKTGMIA